MILVDTSHAIFRTLMMNKEQVKENPEFLSHLLISQILGFASKLGASKQNKLVLAIDSTSWRKQYYEDNKKQFPEMQAMTYKGNRVKDQTIDWESVFTVIDATLTVIKNFTDFYVVKVEDAEADDIIAVLTQEYACKETIWIASSDKDFIQLQNTPRVNIYDPLKQAFKPDQNVEMFKKIHTMIGDASDNIPAIKSRLGEKTALKILKDLDTLLATNPDMRAHYQFNEHLILFEHIPDEIRNKIIDEFKNQTYDYNGMKLLTEFTKLKLVKYTEDINRFKLSENEVKTKLNQHFIENATNTEMSNRNLEDFFS